MVEVIINGTSIDLISKGVKYVKQVNDLADISTVNTSFTYSIRVDKTPKNTKLFHNLAMIGDTSTFPYRKNTTQLIDNGAVLISRGISTVKETNEEYKLFIQDGIVEVFKLIENKTIGKDLDLSELAHSKTPQIIIDSWNFGSPYRYLIGDYNGKINEGNGLDGNYLIPSANVKYLWDKVFNKIGYTYSGPVFPLEKEWITYPKPSTTTADQTLRFSQPTKTYWIDSNGQWEYRIYPIQTQYKIWEPSPTTPDGVTPLPGWKIKIDQAGNYRIRLQSLGKMGWHTNINSANDIRYFDFKIGVKIGNNIVGQTLSNDPNNTFTETQLGNLGIGTIIEIVIIPLNGQEIAAANPNNQVYQQLMNLFDDGTFYPDRIRIANVVELYTTEIEVYDFNEAFGSFSLKDFFKEVMFRQSFTPFVDNNARHVHFEKLGNRLLVKQFNVVDWSGKYIRRVNETYVYDGYAQKNILRFKYNNEDDDYNDGSILVENQNIEDKKTLLQSKFYSPERLPTEIKFSPTLDPEFFPKLKMWEKEIKEEEDAQGNTVQVIEYKGLTNRFHYVSEQSAGLKPIKINGIQSNTFYRADLTGVLWPYIVNDKYGEIHRIFSDTRIHEIELALSAHEFATIDLNQLYYFGQEMQYYLLNKIIWESGKPAKGEFIRVKKG